MVIMRIGSLLNSTFICFIPSDLEMLTPIKTLTISPSTRYLTLSWSPTRAQFYQTFQDKIYEVYWPRSSSRYFQTRGQSWLAPDHNPYRAWCSPDLAPTPWSYGLSLQRWGRLLVDKRYLAVYSASNSTFYFFATTKKLTIFQTLQACRSFPHQVHFCRHC